MSANANANVSEANIKAITETIEIKSDDNNLQLQKETTSDYLNTIQFIKNSVLVNLFTHKYITPFCTIYSSHLMFLKYIKNKKIDINKLDGKYTSILFIFVLKLLEDVIVSVKTGVLDYLNRHSTAMSKMDPIDLYTYFNMQKYEPNEGIRWRYKRV